MNVFKSVFKTSFFYIILAIAVDVGLKQGKTVIVVKVHTISDCYSCYITMILLIEELLADHIR